jgi:predicted 3-demethylubiquinone-9 3-methyltransferase (glyoxalase superfamily)
MTKIVPHLWYNDNAREAAEFYMSLMGGSRLVYRVIIEDTPSGDAEFLSFELAGQPFYAISAGPYFKFNPSISLMVACASADEVDAVYNALIAGGSALMPLGEYPFSPRYGWVQDRFGLSWQLMQTDAPAAQKITPNLLFSDGVCGQAEEAISFYAQVFGDSGVDFVSHYAPGEAQTDKARINYAALHLAGTPFTAMDHGAEGDFTFNEAFSLLVSCADQAEIDRLWDALSAVPEAEQCGWIKDKYGLSWQITPARMDEMYMTGSREALRRVTAAFLPMKKLDATALERAFRGEE